jgi:protein TonB
MTQLPVLWRRTALILAIAAGVALAACSKKEEPAPTAVTPTAATTAAAVSSDAELRTKAQTAEREQRLYAPAGDNAIEYYLALRERQPSDTLVNNALTDLFPYAMTATEQNLQKAGTATDPNQAKTYRTEAARIFALLERVDKNAPSLPRLRDTMQKEASAELKTQQDEAKKAQDLLAKQAEAAKTAAAAAAAQKNAPPPIPAAPVPQPVATRPAAPPPAPVQTRPQPQPAAEAEAPPPKPARPAGGLPNVVSSAQPDYPREALRDGVSGEVTIAFTVNADGSVGAANVVSSNPRNVFDRAAVAAIKKWRFEPPGEPVSGRRTFSFTPGQ